MSENKKTERVTLKSNAEIRKLAKRVDSGNVADVQLYMIVSFMTRNVEKVAHRRAIIRDDLGCVMTAGGEVVPIFKDTDIKSSRALWKWLDALTPDAVAALPLTDGQKVVLVDGIETTKKGGTPSEEFGRTFTKKGLRNLKDGNAAPKSDYDKMIGLLQSATKLAGKGQFSDSEGAHIESAISDIIAAMARRDALLGLARRTFGVEVEELDTKQAANG